MKTIKNLVEHIDEELHDAEKYINCSLRHKHDGSDLDVLFTKLASAELDHAYMLHEAVIKEIDKARDEMHAKGTHIPEAMKELWEDEHEEYIERMSILKHRLEYARK